MLKTNDFLLIIFIFYFILILFIILKDKYNWNNGNCRKCDGNFIIEEECDDIAVDFYKCDRCGKIIGRSKNR